MKEKAILLVKDNADEELLALRALAKNSITNNALVARDGVEALDYLFGTGARTDKPALLPQVVLLDLKPPTTDGRADQRTRLLPVVVLTTSNEEQGRVKSLRSGAHSFVRKPVQFDRFAEAVRELGLYWLLLNEPAPTARKV